ncbi:unnamed protein product [marine sediment metagenome]|uniref:Uncharacterized protein n=1 Tax=marine sediment metagenome TaxID=412755 RepID=X1MYP8_9ZZZZ
MITESDKKYVESLFPALAEIQNSNLREKVIGVWYRGLEGREL